MSLLGVLQGTTGSIGGTVRDADTRQPLAGATVTHLGTRRFTTTDSAGHYLLDGLPAGTSDVIVRRLGYAPGRFQAILALDQALEVSIDLAPQPIELAPLVTHATLPGLVASGGHTEEPGTSGLTREEIRNQPLLAEPDALVALAGGEVVVRNEAPTGLNVRGGTGDQVTHALDGIPLFNPFHSGAVFSALNPDALERLELRGTPLPSEAAQGLSGAVLATTRVPGDRWHLRTGISTTQARAETDGPLPGGLGYLLSLRASFPGLAAHRADPTYLRGSGYDWLAVVPAPAFGGRLQLLGTGSGNSVNASARAAAQLAPGPAPPRNRFEWQGQSFGGGWTGPVGGMQLAVRAWRASGTADATWWALDSLPQDMRSSAGETGLSVELDHPGSRARFTGGMRLSRVTTSYRLHPDTVGGAGLDYHARAILGEPFLRYQHQLGTATTAEFALAATLASRASRLSPSAALRHRIGAATVGLSASRRYQFQQSLRNAESVVGHIFPADLPLLAGSGGVPVARSDEAGALVAYDGGALQVELRGWWRRSRGLALTAPLQADPFLVSRVTPGRGRGEGASVALRWESGPVDLVARYGLQRVRQSFGDTTWVPAWADGQLLDAGALLRPWRGTAIRISLNAEWGAHTTPIEDPFEWEACNLLDQGCEFAGTPHQRLTPLGSAALPAYLRADLGLRQTLRPRVGNRTWTLAAYGTATNLFSRRNLLTRVRNPATGGLQPVTTRPRALLLFGLEWGF